MNSRNASRERGSELVEFALVLSILFALIFGILGIAQAAYAYHFVANAAREATRYASVRGSTCRLLSDCPNIDQTAIQTYVASLAPGGINTSKLTATATWVLPPGGTCNPPEGPGCVVQVDVKYTYAFLPVLNLPPFNMTSTSQMVISQ